MKLKRFLTVGLSVGMLAAAFGSSAAHAAPAGTGYDDNPDVILGGGSDTTYLVQQRIDTLYNGAPGCALDTAGTSATKGKCVTPSTGDVKGNYDHDVTVEAAAIGSGAGINSLLPTGVPYNPAITYARSSRVPSSTELASVTGWGYAKDAIAVVTFGTRSVSLYKQDLINIYTCAVTDWSAIPDHANGDALDLPAGTIIPWDMNTASGTRATFVSYLGSPTFGSCVRKLASGTAPFENDVKPLLADANTTAANVNNMIWWMSYGDWQTYPYTRDGPVAGAGTINSSLVPVANAGPATNLQAPSAGNTNDGSYAILRFLYLVTKNTDADCVQTPGAAGACNNVGNAVYGATSGPGGAVRQFVSWLCHATTGQHTIDTVTGISYKTEINAALNFEGFQPVIGTDRTAGYGCTVAT